MFRGYSSVPDYVNLQASGTSVRSDHSFLSVSEWTHSVINFFSSVKTPDDKIVHFFIDKLLDVIIQKYTIRSYSKTEVLVMEASLFSSVCDQVF